MAHKNELFVAKITNLSDKFPIKWGEITDLLNLCIDVVSKNPRNFDEKDATSYKKYYQINRRKCEQDTKFVFEY